MEIYEVQNLEVDAEITTFRITRKTTLIEDCFIVSDTQEKTNSHSFIGINSRGHL